MLYDLFKYSFKKAGEKAPDMDNASGEEIWVDLGSLDYSDERKVFDHHHNDVDSSLSVVLSHMDIFDNIHRQGNWENKYTIVTHTSPDTDAIFTTWAVQKLISLGKEGFLAAYGNIIDGLREYVDRIDSGSSMKIDLDYPCATIYVYICLIDEVLKMDHENSGTYWPSSADKMKKGLELAECAVDRLNEGSFDILRNPLGYKYDEILKKVLEDDIELYNSDRNVTFLKIRVPVIKSQSHGENTKPTHGTKEVQAAIWHGPSKSVFGYLYARQGKGRCTTPCILTAVPSYDRNSGRLKNYRISLDNNNKESKKLTLLPLAVALEYMEQIEEIIESYSTHRTRRNYGAGRGTGIFERPPFNAVSDPWYISDDYSMIDIPTAGTLIPEKDIIKMVCNNASILRRTARIAFKKTDAEKITQEDRNNQKIYTASFIDISDNNNGGTCNLQEWIDDCRSKIKSFSDNGKNDIHMLICAEVNAAIIPYNNFLLKYLCMSMAGLGFEGFNEEKIMSVDRNTCIYATDKFTLILAATRTDGEDNLISSEYERDIFRICSFGQNHNITNQAAGEELSKENVRFSESNLMKSSIVNMLQKLLYIRHEFTDMCGKIGDLPYEKRKQIVKENDRLLTLMTEMLCADVRDDEFEQSIYSYLKERFALEEIKDSVQSCMNVVATDSSERAYNVFTILSGITIPFVLVCNLFQTGLLDFAPLLGTSENESSYFTLPFGWAWGSSLLVTILLGVVLIFAYLKKRRKRK